MSDAILAIARAVETMAQNNLDGEMSTAKDIFFLIGAAFPLNLAWSVLLKKDQETYFEDSLLTVNDPSYAAKAAADYSKYSMDSSEMSRETNYQNQILQAQKTMVRTQGNSMDQIYNLELPMHQMQKGTNSAILSLMKG